MYICNCNGITERQIHDAVEIGCGSVAELHRNLGVGTCCGKCIPEARKLLRARHQCAQLPEARAAGDD